MNHMIPVTIVACLMIAAAFVLGYKHGIEKGLGISLKWNSKVMAKDFGEYSSREKDPILKKMFDDQVKSYTLIHDGCRDITDPYYYLLPSSWR